MSPPIFKKRNVDTVQVLILFFGIANSDRSSPRYNAPLENLWLASTSSMQLKATRTTNKQSIKTVIMYEAEKHFGNI